MATSYPEHDAARRNLERIHLRRLSFARLAAASARSVEIIERLTSRRVVSCCPTARRRYSEARNRLRALLPALGVLMLAAPIETEETSYRR